MKRTRIRQFGVAARRRAEAWALTVKLVRERAAGECESCHRPSKQLDPHHIWKRGNRIPRALADRPECVAAVCRACHNFVEAHPRSEVQRTLEWRSLVWLGVELRPYATDDLTPLWTPLQILRDHLRRMETLAA